MVFSVRSIAIATPKVCNVKEEPVWSQLWGPQSLPSGQTVGIDAEETVRGWRRRPPGTGEVLRLVPPTPVAVGPWATWWAAAPPGLAAAQPPDTA